MTFPTKASIRDAYIRILQVRYPFYTEGSKPLELAYLAADKALTGQVKLEGECWELALGQHGLPKRITLKALKELPEN
jgi:hypothetical protein